MIDLYYWPTPNGWKVTIALEEMELPYRVLPVNLGRGEQFEPAFREVSPNNRMPAIVDSEPLGGGMPISVFESGAILLYLADKSGRFLPKDPEIRFGVISWLMWQVGGLGPMLGQHGHFRLYAEDKIPYAINRYRKETERLYGVLDERLKSRDFICDLYSVADIACWPWVLTYKRQGIDLDSFPHVRRWYNLCKERSGLRRGYEVGRGWHDQNQPHDKQARRVLFGN